MHLYTFVGLFIAVIYWILDSSIHHFGYSESVLEIIPHDFNELWMRIVIVVLIVLFGVFADHFSARLVRKEKQIEALKIYYSMRRASHHVLNNLLNQLQLFKMEALKSKDFDPEILKRFDTVVNEAGGLIEKLSSLDDITKENIWASVNPEHKDSSPDKVNPVDT